MGRSAARRDSGRWEWYDSARPRTWQARRATRSISISTISSPVTADRSAPTIAQETYERSTIRAEPVHPAHYNSPLTNRLLLEAGFGASISQWNVYWHPGVSPDDRQRHRRRAAASATGRVHLSRPPELHQPLHAAGRGDVRDRDAHVQDRFSDRAAGHRHSSSPTGT